MARPAILENRVVLMMNQNELVQNNQKKNQQVIAWVSFLNNWSSEAHARITPVFIATTMGAPMAVIGLIHGVPDLVATCLKFFSGVWSDRIQKQKVFVVIGYLFAALSRLWMGFASTQIEMFSTRFLERIGNGIRTAPRDVLIKNNSESRSFGKSFGAVRFYDGLGQGLGYLTAILVLSLPFFDQDNLSTAFRCLFFVSCIPIFIAVMVAQKGLTDTAESLSLIKFNGAEKNGAQKKTIRSVFDDVGHLWTRLSPSLKLFLVIQSVVTFAGGSEILFMIKFYQDGASLRQLFGALLLASFCSSVSAKWIGKFYDRTSPKNSVILSWMGVALFYVMLASPIPQSLLKTVFIFMFFGLSVGTVDVVTRSFIAVEASSEDSGKVYGLFQTLSGLAIMPGTFIFGLVWDYWTAQTAFLLSTGMILCMSVLFFTQFERSTPSVEKVIS